MKWSELQIIFAKDFMELVRKPASLLLGLFLPGVFMPIFVLSINDLQSKLSEQIKSLSFELALEGQSKHLSEWFEKTKRVKLVTPVREAVPGKSVDAVLVIPADFDTAIDNQTSAGKLSLRYDSMKENSMLSSAFIIEQLLKFKESVVETRLKNIGLETHEQPVFKFIDVDEALQKKHLSRYHAASFLLLILFSLYGAASAAAAETVTAERERNTLEALLLTPVKRQTIVIGKLLLTFCMTMFAAVLTMITYSAKFLTTPDAKLQADTLILLQLLSLPLLVMLALTVVSMSMLLAAYARTVQQSMGYSFYLALVLFGAAGLAFNPSVSLASPAVFLPISGLSVAIVDIWSGRPDWIFIALATAVGAGFCALFTMPAAHLLQSDESLFNLQVSPQQRLREGLWSKPLVFLFVGVFLGMFYIGQALAQWKGLPALLLTQFICVLGPALAFLKAYGLPFKETLSWNKCRFTDLIGAACLAPFTVVFASWLFEVQSKFMPVPEEFLKVMNEMLLPAGTPWWQIIPSLALAPAFCEEILFRGVFQGLLSKRVKDRYLVPIIGIIFGTFHFSVYRFVPTAALGCVLSILVLRTGSIFPAMVLHASHNGISALISTQKDKSMTVSAENWILILISLAIGIALLFWKRSNSTASENL